MAVETISSLIRSLGSPNCFDDMLQAQQQAGALLESQAIAHLTCPASSQLKPLIQVSKSHKGHVISCIATAAPVAIGIDIETPIPISRQSWGLVFTEAERDRLALAPVHQQGRLSCRLFSLKEAVFKCLNAIEYYKYQCLNELPIYADSVDLEPHECRPLPSINGVSTALLEAGPLVATVAIYPLPAIDI